MIRTPSPLRGTPPIAPFHFATEGELGCDSWENRGGAGCDSWNNWGELG